MNPTTLETPVLPLLYTVFTAILEVFLLCLVGYRLASYGILDKHSQKQLNRLNISLFTPSLLFSKVAFFLSPAKLRELWIIPIFFVLVTIVSMIVSFILATIFRLKRSQRSFAMAAAMFMNSNSLPIALMQSLVITVPGLKWDEDDNKNAMLGRALSYLVMYSTFGMVLRWSVGVKLLSQADPEPIPGVSDPITTGSLIDYSDEPSLPSVTAENGGMYHHGSIGSNYSTQNGENLIDDEEIGQSRDTVAKDNDRLRPPTSGRLNRLFYSFPNSPNSSQLDVGPSVDPTPAASDFETSDTDSDDDPLSGQRPRRQHHFIAEPTSTRFQSFVRRSRNRITRIWKRLNNFMTVPLWAALASFTVACIQPLQHSMDAHMPAVKNALASAGSCSIPVTLIVLGAYFYQPPKPSHPANGLSTVRPTVSVSSLMDKVRSMLDVRSWRNKATMKKNDYQPGETTTVVISVLSRMVITPLLILPMMVLSTKFALHSAFEDPVFVLVNVLLISSPPALTLAQITQAASGDAFERLISKTIFWSYCIVTPPTIIINVVIGLLITKLSQ